ncbi:hypothetical protein FALB51S_00008 [Frigidibacter albus]|jgi:hypothetical protein
MKTATTVVVALLSLTLPAFAQQGQGGGQPGAQFIQNWDLSDNGHVSRADFLQRRDDIFRMFDVDETDVLEHEELQAIAEHLAAEQGQPGHGDGGRGPGRIIHDAMTLQFNDVNGDGVISRAEFAESSARVVDMLDVNGDGKIDMADFR